MLENDDPEYAAQAKAFREQLEEETREQTLAAKEAYRAKRKAQREGDEIDTDDDEDDSDMEVIYVRD
jgi:GTP-binding protein